MAEADSKARETKDGRKRRWWDRPSARRWLAGVAAGLLVTVGGAVITHFLLAPSRSDPQGPVGNPVLVESAAYVHTNDPVFSFSKALTSQQAHAVTENGYFADGQPRWNDWEGYINLIANYGGAPNEATIQMVLKGNADQAVTITNIRVVKRCGPPLTGTLLLSPGGAAPPDIRLWYTLDAPYPVAQSQTRTGRNFDFFAQRTIQLKPGAVNTLLVSATAYDHACSFRLEMTVDDGQRQVTETISNGKRAFVVTAAAGVYSPKPYLKFSDYKAIYVGGSGRPGHYSYVRVDPKTFHW